MAENLLVGSHKVSTKEYRDGWDRIFGKKRKNYLVSTFCGFDLVPIRGEGKPVHPDLMDCELTEEQYKRQLKAYKKCYDNR